MPSKVPQPVTPQVPALPDSEDAARDYLVSTGVLRVPSSCPACGNTTIRQIRRNQCRCRHCSHEWSIRRGSILEGQRISFRTFLLIVRYFADDLPANDAASRTGIAYNTVYKMYRRIRDSVLVPAAPGNHMSSDLRKKGPESTRGSVDSGGTGTAAAMNRLLGPSLSYNGDGNDITGANGKKKQVVFGIRLAEGTVTIAPVLCPDPEIIAALPIPTMQRGNILFIDAYGKKYQGFITYVPDRHGKDIVRIRARDGLPWSPLGEFWNFAGKTWMSHRGLDRDSIPEFVQELAFRYNNRDHDLLPVLLERIATLYTRF